MKGILIQLEALPRSEDKIEELLSRLTAMNKQAGHKAWYTFRSRGDKYGIFMVADTEQALSGPREIIMRETGDFFATAPTINFVDILEYKLPLRPSDEDTKAVLLTFKAKEEHEQQAEEFLINARALAMRETDTTSWFAFRLRGGEYGIFDTFPGNTGRLQHLVGRIPRKMISQAFSLMVGFPEMRMLDILEEQSDRTDTPLTA